LVTEEIMLLLARHTREVTGLKNLCLAGGVALNCVANGIILREKIFDRIWIQPAAGDAGGALGAALAAWYDSPENARVAEPADSMQASLLGPGFLDEEIETMLRSQNAVFQKLDSETVLDFTVEQLKAEKVVGWFQGRMEFGPRSLGARSILGDPRDRDMQTTMNLKIKFRESFRPFAPAVLADDAERYFELKQPSPYMLLVADVSTQQRIPVAEDSDVVGLDRLKAPRSTIPAVTHVDLSARVQTVNDRDNPRFHRLLTEFKRATGCPVLVNTSFNVRGEPIVRSPEDAYVCFMRTDMDVLVLGEFLLHKADQPAWAEDEDWRRRIPLD
jgi:carbamoyltransferase